MKVKKAALTILITGGLILLAGCAGEQNTIDEPEITAEYLASEYAAQLVRDGAKSCFGSIDIYEDEEGTVWVDVTEKEFVEDKNQPNGFYIAYKNIESTYQLSLEARATFLPGGSSAAVPMDALDFIEAVYRDLEEYGEDNPEYHDMKLYNIYAIDDMIELLIAWYIP